MYKNQGKILIVDDNDLNRELLCETLAPLNYEILSYSNPVLALKELRDTKIDAALVDVVMPEIDGFFFAEKFTETHKNTPVVYISAHSENENKIKGYNLGSYVYIEKPFDVQTVRAQVHSVLKLKKVQDELLKEKEQLDMIFKFSNNEIMITDLNFNILSQNNAILKKNDCSSKNFLHILEMHEHFENAEELKDFSISRQKLMTFRFIVGKTRYTKTNVSKIFTNENHTGYLIFMENRTEEVRRESLRESFIEMLTHDLKTPVRAEKRALELLYDGSFGELNLNQKDIIKEILNSSRYMMRMTDNVLARYKLENESYTITKTSNSIKKTIQKCIGEINYLLEDANQTLKVNIDLENSAFGDVFDYDEKDISLVLTNLIANASEHSPSDSEISVSVTRSKNDILVSVKDNGCGIAKEDMKSLFTEKTSKEIRFKKVSSGMGLFIVKKIIEAHKGRITVNSKPGCGSEFIVTLPAINSQKAALIKT